MLFGAQSITMCDIFENAVNTAAENAAKNHIDPSCCRTFCGNIIDDEGLRERIGTGYDVICANIVADVIIGMAPLFGGFMKPGARLIVSGVIDERLDEVLAALRENGFTVLSEKNEEGWNCVLLAGE